MKRCAWLFLPLAALLLTGTTLPPAPPQTACRPSPAPCAAAEGAAPTRAADLFASPAGRCWYTGQPHHWHACLLQQP